MYCCVPFKTVTCCTNIKEQSLSPQVCDGAGLQTQALNIVGSSIMQNYAAANALAVAPAAVMPSPVPVPAPAVVPLIAPVPVVAPVAAAAAPPSQEKQQPEAVAPAVAAPVVVAPATAPASQVPTSSQRENDDLWCLKDC